MPDKPRLRVFHFVHLLKFTLTSDEEPKSPAQWTGHYIFKPSALKLRPIL